jgi:glucose repression regulatory protein TUP1
MGGGPPANGAGSRLNELLDGIRAEFESNIRQTETFDHQCKTPMSLYILGFGLA